MRGAGLDSREVGITVPELFAPERRFLSLRIQSGYAEQPDGFLHREECSGQLAVTFAEPLRSPIGPTTVRLREINSKSANLTLSVTVRPRVPLSSQCRQTLSISGCSSATIASNSVRSVKKVFSAPTDFRIWSARSSRLSTPREIQQ